MNRMHPEDLRAIVAAVILSNNRHDGIISHAVVDTDVLLAELKRTAKPEPKLVPNPCPGLMVEDRDTFDRIVQFRLGTLLQEREAKLVQAIKDEGAREERERLIDILVYGQGHPIRAFKCHEGGATLANELEVKAALEPKP